MVHIKFNSDSKWCIHLGRSLFLNSIHLSRPKASTPANGQGDRIRQQTLQEIFTRERCPDRKCQRSQSRFRRIFHRQVQERDVSLHGIQRHRQVPGRLARPSEKLQRHPTRCTARFGSKERWPPRRPAKENSVSFQSRGQSSHHPQGQNVPQRISSKINLRSVRSESSVQKGKPGGVQTERLKRRKSSKAVSRRPNCKRWTRRSCSPKSKRSSRGERPKTGRKKYWYVIWDGPPSLTDG